MENYGALTINHLADAGVRQGNRNGAICNCNGLWAQGSPGSLGQFDDYPSAPRSLQVSCTYSSLPIRAEDLLLYYVADEPGMVNLKLGWTYESTADCYVARRSHLGHELKHGFCTRE